MNVSFRGLGQLGRLGNSLWQAASCLGVARSRGVEPRLPASWPYRPFLSIPDDVFTDDFAGCVELTACGETTHLGKYAVYAQDLALWSHAAGEVRAWFAPSALAETILKDLYSEFFALPRPILSVHVRRGDNAYDPLTPDKWRYHPLRPLRYYREAIDRLLDEMDAECVSLACFGDDPDWNREHIPADWFGDGRSRSKECDAGYATEAVLDWADLFLQTYADRHILSNSTFSWWGAWLSGDPSPAYPWPWFGSALADDDASLMFPESWTRIDHGPYVPGEE